MSSEHLDNERRHKDSLVCGTMSEIAENPGVDGAKLEPRVSLWTVPERWGGWFFVLLVAQGGVLIGLHTWRALTLMPHVHVVDTVLSEVLVATPMLVFAGILSMIELEVALTLSRWYERRSLEKDKERYEAGLKEGEKRGEKRGERRGEKRGWEKGIEEGRRLEREELMAEIAAQTAGDVADKN